MDAAVHLCGSSRLPANQLFTVLLSFPSKFKTERKKCVSDVQSRIYCISWNKIQLFFECPFIMSFHPMGIMLQPNKYNIAITSRSALALQCPGGAGPGACTWSGWCGLPCLPGSGWLSPPQSALRLCDTISGVAHAEETYRNKPKWVPAWGRRKFLHEHRVPLSKALRMLKTCKPPPLLREDETVHLGTQRDAQEVSVTPGQMDRF